MVRPEIRPVPVTLVAPGYHYPDGVAALAEIRLSVAGGERVAILGQNEIGRAHV